MSCMNADSKTRRVLRKKTGAASRFNHCGPRYEDRHNLYVFLQRLFTHTHTHARTHARTHTRLAVFSGTTRVSRYQKGKTNLNLTEAKESEWQWHQLGHIQVCTSLHTDNHASTSLLSFYRPDALPAAQPTASKH